MSSPGPWVDLVKGLREGICLPLYRPIANPGGLSGVRYVPFLYTPKTLRRWYGDFYWTSIARTVRSVIRTCRPELIIAYRRIRTARPRSGSVAWPGRRRV